MSFSELPRELLALIAEHATTRDALALAATSQYHFKVLNDLIYSRYIRHDQDGSRLLQWACTEGSSFALATARRALALGARVDGEWTTDSQDSHGKSYILVPLLTAIEHQHIGAIDLLLAHGADPRAQRVGTCAMGLAARIGNVEIVRLLIAALPRVEGGVETDAAVATESGAHSNGSRRLAGVHESSIMGHDAVLRLLLDHGADVNIYDRHGNTPLHMALLASRSDVVRILLDAGANPFAEDPVGESCLDQALPEACTQNTVRSDADTQKFDRIVADFGLVLRQARAVWDARSAVDHGNQGAAADFWLGKSESETHDFLVKSQGLPAVARLLIEIGGIPVDARSWQDGATPLWWFAGHNSSCTAKREQDVVEIVGMLLDAGADINAQDTAQGGQTPLMRAAEAWLDNVVALLLSRGARVDIRDQAGLGVLAWATQSASVLQRLLDHERDGSGSALSPEMAKQLELCDLSGRTPLIRALWGGEHADAAEVLIRAGADVLPRDKFGNDALTIAASYDATAYLVPLLVERGAPVNPSSSRHPLLAAVGSESLAGVKVLIEHGTDPDGRMPIGLECSIRQTRLPLACAVRDGSIDIARALLESGASVELALACHKNLLDICRSNDSIMILGLLHEFDAAR